MSGAPPQIIDLVRRFESNVESYRSSAYNETQLRREFIDPFFEALGWDVINKAGYAEAYKDVIHEDAIKVGGATKAPDYCFRIGGARKFFVETKRPAISIKDDPSPAYQLRRYAWSAKLPLSILTDFEEFAVYDCRIPPKPTDKPSTGRIFFLSCKEYAARWEEITSIFSKEAVLRGSFDKFVTGRGKRGTAEVDAEFLMEIENWRESLARNLALRNPHLSVRELNFAVQRTIDRIIFLRMCEDRGIENYGQLQALVNGVNIYDRLRYIYGLADDRYNSGLFHFKREKGRAEEPDELTPTLTIDDKVLKDMIHRLYYPESPYEFSVLSADILGNVYEQFLGKVIRLTAGHHAVVEEKPEVKKAGGVYYTPAYIVDYIVKNTVGRLCEGKTPKQISKLRILDPACGSGSFLIGAYTYLFNYHRDWYVKDGPQKHTKEIYQGAGGQWLLTTQEKKRILLNNIYGVDIDSQAVEVTKLSLLLKVLEGENRETLARQLRMWRERALPDLGRNIKCGNSLIGPDFFEGSLLPDEEALHRMNPFDWNTEFPTIFPSPLPVRQAGSGRGKGEGSGGFDTVIGNPPYGASFGEQEAQYFRNRYKVFSGVRDVYTCFMEKASSLLNFGGKFSFIVPSAWLGGPEYENLRELLLTYRIETVVLLPFDVFADAYIDTTVFVVSKSKAIPARKVKTHVYAKREKLKNIELSEDDYKRVNQNEWANTEGKKFVLDPGATYLLRQICKGASLTFGTVVEIKRGVLFDKELLTQKRTSENSYRYFEGDVYRYQLNLATKHWVEFGDKMKERPKEFIWFEGPRILLRRLVNRRQRLMATVAIETFITNKNLYSILSKEKTLDIRAILGVLNSRLISHLYISQVTQAVKDDFPQVTIKDILALPFPIRVKDKVCHDKMVTLVDRMLGLHKRLKVAKTPDDKTQLQRQIDATDKQIDPLVYELYGLTGKEIAIVEGTAVASKRKLWDNGMYETAEEPSNRPDQAERQASEMAKTARYAGEGGSRTPEGSLRPGRPINGVREGTGEYRPSQDPPERKENDGQIDSTRLFETAEGVLSYSQVSERVAFALTGILSAILQIPPDQIAITPEWICMRHQTLAGNLFPQWAGRCRDVNVRVGTHTPPPFYEVPGLLHLFCDDLAERLRHVRPGRSTAAEMAELLAWADWRLQWVHPFKDFNGRIGRILLAAVLFKLALPHVETAPQEPDARRQYLEALRAADRGNLGPLTDLWVHRLAKVL